MLRRDPHRIAYILKMYPRFSETFIVHEVLAHQEAGVDLEIVSLRPPLDGRFHALLAEVQVPVTYLTHRGRRVDDLWALLGEATTELPALAEHLDQLLTATVDDAAQALDLARLVRARGITHLHAHFGSVATTVARLASILTGVPYTFTAHAKDIFHDEVDPADLGRKLADAKAVATVSDFNLGHLRRVHGSAANRVQRVYNGLDLARFGFVDPARRSARLLAVGRLVEKKGFADLIDACALLAAARHPVDCDVVGAGPCHDDLAARITARGLDGRVNLVGPLPQEAVRRLVQGAALLAAPCVVAADGNRDGLPTVLLEAMALGTPCVATDVVGIPELVRHGVTGLLVPEHDPHALAAALARLLEDGALRSRLALAARALLEEDFDVRQQAGCLRQLFTLAPAEAVA